jgi:hypothetical protein
MFVRLDKISKLAAVAQISCGPNGNGVEKSAPGREH